MLSDQTRNFLSLLIKQIYYCYGVDKVRTSAYHPLGNGCCEKFNRTLHGFFITDEKAKKWAEHVSKLVAQYNATTGDPPFHLLFGRKVKLPRDAVAIHDQKEPLDEWVSEIR